MDSFTQAALGASIAHGVFRDRLGPKAGLFGALCAIVPDFDIIAAQISPWASMEHHRGLTHSILVIPFYAALLGILGWWRWGRSDSKWPWICCAFWAVWTHPLLDLCNQYGTPLLDPLVDKRYAWDAISILDPFFSLPLFIAMALAGWKRISVPLSRKIVMGTLCFSLSYLGLGYGVGRLIESQARMQLAEDGIQADEVRACPMLFTIFLRRIIAREPDGTMHVAYASALHSARFDFMVYPIPDSQLAAASIRHPKGELFSWFAMGMISPRVPLQDDGNTKVVLVDMRYGFLTNPDATPFSAEFIYSADGQLLSVSRPSPRRNVEVRDELRAMWDLLLSGTVAKNIANNGTE